MEYKTVLEIFYYLEVSQEEAGVLILRKHHEVTTFSPNRKDEHWTRGPGKWREGGPGAAMGLDIKQQNPLDEFMRAICCESLILNSADPTKLEHLKNKASRWVGNF